MVSIAFATPIQWSGNNHWYEVVDSGAITWTDANTAAGVNGGFLASITSDAENIFVSGLVNTVSWGAYGPWIGAFRNANDTNWNTSGQWTDGSTWGYTNWDSSQPTNTGGNQYYVHYYPNNGAANLTWNDSADNGYGNTRITGYVIEYANQPSAVPEPASLLLFGIGLLGMSRISRKNI